MDGSGSFTNNDNYINVKVMGSNHMHDVFRNIAKKEAEANKKEEPKFPIPTHDPQTGELNMEYEALTGKKNPLQGK